ncbi:MAG: nucleotidyl transferase AbiEii/AbiGii toxin family protein [Pseudonocardia sp.]
MLDPAEAQAVAEQFGAAPSQVARDHLVSHLLAALSAHASDQVIFFGGTALARTLLPDGRLSEDVDLIAVEARRDVAEQLHRVVPRALRREFPSLRWDPALPQLRDVEPAVLHTSDGLTVRIQLLSSTGYPTWPVERLSLRQRYRDAPPAQLTVPTSASFAAAKTIAWLDRAAARDLYDLWALAEHDHITAEAGRLFAQHGPTNRPPTTDLFRGAPDETRWRRDLGGQLRLTITAATALAVVRVRWAAASRAEGG